MVILAILVLIVKSPFLILRYLFQNKVLLICVVIIAVAFIAVSSLNKPTSSQSMVEIPEYQKKAPDVSKAPYVIATPSRVFYGADYSDDGQVVTLNSFYFYDRKKWEVSELPLPLNRDTVGEIKIYQR